MAYVGADITLEAQESCASAHKTARIEGSVSK